MSDDNWSDSDEPEELITAHFLIGVDELDLAGEVTVMSDNTSSGDELDVEYHSDDTPPHPQHTPPCLRRPFWADVAGSVEEYGLDGSEPMPIVANHSGLAEDSESRDSLSEIIRLRLISRRLRRRPFRAVDGHVDGTDPMPSQANDSGLDLRPVQASIDLRRRPSVSWREDLTRVLGHSRVSSRVRRRRTPMRYDRTAGAGDGRRLRGGQPGTRHLEAALMDHQYGQIYLGSGSEPDDNETMPPWAMVPRRGNSVSDLSQCSSDEEQPHAEL
ncbi:hypothetical protein KR044_006364 [Drosophila immigrans]|nr:hypothetical protein KR044_006364 [Drosophila immigrans]